jgi:formate hydrogenlyase subunit 6/NADH:ubiquinone oxidoreductase subunit I
MLETIGAGFMKRGAAIDRYPDAPCTPYDGHLGMPSVDGSKCRAAGACERACPTAAIRLASGRLSIDLGLCIFCGECVRACPHQAMTMTKEFELASKTREGLVRSYAIGQ